MVEEGTYTDAKRTNQSVLNQKQNVDQFEHKLPKDGTYVSTQVRKSPGPEWSSPIRVQVPELVWGSSYLGPGLILSFLCRKLEDSTFSPFTAYVALRCQRNGHYNTCNGSRTGTARTGMALHDHCPYRNGTS